MYILLILFFVSLIGISFMIGRKVVMLRNGKLSIEGDNYFSKIYILEQWKHKAFRSFRKHHHAGLVATVRLYVKSAGFMKNRYEDIKTKISNRSNENDSGGTNDTPEASKFLKMMSEYKRKIKRIKQKIREEENKL